jgi:hypothetical protein
MYISARLSQSEDTDEMETRGALMSAARKVIKDDQLGTTTTLTVFLAQRGLE